MYAHCLSSRNVLLAMAVSLQLGAVSLPAQADRKERPRIATYEVDADASRVYVKVGTATRLGHEHGVQGKLKSGKLTLRGGGELVFDMASFTADTAEARKRVGLEKKKVSANEAKKVTETMRGADVLDVTKYPTATYRIDSITPLDKQAAGEPGTYQVDGSFTLHGTGQKLPFKAKVERGDKGGPLRMSGTFTIKQTDYGIKPYSAAGGLAKVADELEISGDLELKPKSDK
jgi:polyisoprenoid-binding protein YceI